MSTNGCSPIDFLNGGTLTEVHIFNSEFVNGYITNSILSNVTLNDNIKIDDSAAQALVNQICKYIQDCVAPLIETVVTTDVPEQTVSGDIPTTIIGTSRDRILGAPVTWIQLGDYIVPAYVKA